MGPPGPRGPPGRVEVLSSVSITQVKALPHAFHFAKGGIAANLSLQDF